MDMSNHMSSQTFTTMWRIHGCYRLHMYLVQHCISDCYNCDLDQMSCALWAITAPSVKHSCLQLKCTAFFLDQNDLHWSIPIQGCNSSRHIWSCEMCHRDESGWSQHTIIHLGIDHHTLLSCSHFFSWLYNDEQAIYCAAWWVILHQPIINPRIVQQVAHVPVSFPAIYSIMDSLHSVLRHI